MCRWQPVISKLESLIWLWHTSAHEDNFNIVDTMFNLGLQYMSFRREVSEKLQMESYSDIS